MRLHCDLFDSKMGYDLQNSDNQENQTIDKR